MQRQKKKVSSLYNDGKVNLVPAERFTAGELLATTNPTAACYVPSPQPTFRYKEWIAVAEAQQKFWNQRRLTPFVMRAYSYWSITTMLLIFLQGVGVLNLDGKVLTALAVSTVGQVGGLVTLVIKEAFRKSP